MISEVLGIRDPVELASRAVSRMVKKVERAVSLKLFSSGTSTGLSEPCRIL